eukprot:TRINITY_DN1534_c0_g1_i3.p2 TRINITY_DN1534_c0_g1~~TRINITY_DN1534_c0_g1_i3.p2  ORF type:complete len:125 (+),score=32.45 TRINITY_DN1534_c0_g1_i3:440-814(+)
MFAQAFNDDGTVHAYWSPMAESRSLLRWLGAYGPSGAPGAYLAVVTRLPFDLPQPLGAADIDLFKLLVLDADLSIVRSIEVDSLCVFDRFASFAIDADGLLYVTTAAERRSTERLRADHLCVEA